MRNFIKLIIIIPIAKPFNNASPPSFALFPYSPANLSNAIPVFITPSLILPNTFSSASLFSFCSAVSSSPAARLSKPSTDLLAIFSKIPIFFWSSSYAFNVNCADAFSLSSNAFEPSAISLNVTSSACVNFLWSSLDFSFDFAVSSKDSAFACRDCKSAVVPRSALSICLWADSFTSWDASWSPIIPVSMTFFKSAISFAVKFPSAILCLFASSCFLVCSSTLATRFIIASLFCFANCSVRRFRFSPRLF